jgi:Domain of unknown function (DUF1707)
MFAPSDLRASDADREATVEFLKRHYEAGRLTHDELSGRVDAAYAARYESQLRALARDLPAVRPAAAAPAPRARGARFVAVGAASVLVLLAALELAPPNAWLTVVGVLFLVALVALLAVSPVAIPVLLVVWIVRRLGRASRGLPPGPGAFLGR